MYHLKYLFLGIIFGCFAGCSLMGDDTMGSHTPAPSGPTTPTNPPSADQPTMGIPIVFLSTTATSDPTIPPFPPNSYLIAESSTATVPTSPSQIPGLSIYNGLTGQFFCMSLPKSYPRHKAQIFGHLTF
jgi:hypothetical protein